MGFSVGPRSFFYTDPDLYSKLVNQYGADTANLLSTGTYGSFDRDYGARTQAMQLALDDPKQFAEQYGKNLGFSAAHGVYDGMIPNAPTLAAKFMSSAGVAPEQIKQSLNEGGNQYSSLISDNGDWASGITSGLSDFLNSDLGKVAMVAAAYFGGPAAVDALTSGAVSSASDAIAVSSAVAAPETAAAVAAASPDAAAAIAAAVPDQAVAIAAAVPDAASAIAAAVPDAAPAIAQAVPSAAADIAAAAPANTTALADIQANTGFTSELPAGSAYTAPEVTKIADLAAAPATTATDAGTAATGAAATGADLGSKVGIQATPGAGLDLATTSAAPGIQTGVTGTNLADMTGQGLTTVGATGGVLGAEGINAANAATTAGVGATAANVGTGANAIGNTLSNINTGVTAANVANAATGNTLADILPYTTGAGVISSVIGANAATSAADTQAAAAKAAIDQQQANFNTINQQQAPYRAAGYTALNDIAGLTTGKTPQYDASGNVVKDAAGNPVMTTGSGYLQHQFDASDLKNGLAPNYDFMLQQGQMANQRAGNVGGGGLSGNTLQGLQKYTQDYAGNAYQQAFNNYQTQRTGIYNTLASIAGIGQTGQTATNTAATNATNAATQLGVGSAAAQAAGQTGAANAYSNALGNVTNNYTLAALLNQGGKVTG